MAATDTNPPINVRGVDAATWHSLRVVAVERHQSAGALLTEIIDDWLSRQASAETRERIDGVRHRARAGIY